MLPGPSPRSTNFDGELILQSIFLVISFVLEQQAWFRVCVVPMVPMTFGFIISVDLMSSPTSYIFSKPLDKCVMIIINILGSSKISIEFLMRNIILCPRWFGLIIHNIIAFPPTQKLFLFCVVPWVPCYPTYVMILPRSITIFDVKNVVRIAPPLKNSWYSDTSHHHHSFLVLALIPTGVPTSEWCCLDSALLATLLLWS